MEWVQGLADGEYGAVSHMIIPHGTLGTLSFPLFHSVLTCAGPCAPGWSRVAPTIDICS